MDVITKTVRRKQSNALSCNVQYRVISKLRASKIMQALFQEKN